MNNRLKIGLVLDDTLDKPDGVQAAVLDIGKELSSRGHEVHYLVTDTKRDDIKNVHSLGGFVSLPFNGNSVRTPKPASRRTIKKLLNSLDLDVLHVQMPYSPLMAGRVVASAGEDTKVFGTFHILPYDRLTSIGTKLLGIFLKKNLNKFDGFFAVSKPARVFMKDTFGVDGEVLANPVDYAFYSAFNKQKSDKKQVVYVGRFDERKGVRQLVESYSLLPEKIQANTELTMCGKGPLLDEMKQLADQKQIAIHFPGFVSDEQKAQYLADADVAVFPSTSGESFGIVLAEAMSAKAGVTIGGDNPGYRSVLGLEPRTLFNPNNFEEFARVLESFLTDDKLRTSIGGKQHDFVHEFDIQRIVDTLEKAYER